MPCASRHCPRQLAPTGTIDPRQPRSCRIEGNAARRIGGGKPISEGLQSGHVGAGKPNSRNGPDQCRRPEIVGDQAEQRGGEAAHGRPRCQYVTRVDSVGERRQQRHRNHVAERIGARHQSCLRCAQSPQRHKVLRHDRGDDHVREEVADLSQAHCRDESAPGQRRHRLLISILIEQLLTGIQYFYTRRNMEKSKAVAALAARHRIIASMPIACLSTRDQWAASGPVAAALGLAPNTLTFHFARLRTAGLVSWREGLSMIYAARDHTMNALLGYLTHNCCKGASATGAPIAYKATRLRRAKVLAV